MFKVSFTGHASTQAIQAVQFKLFTVSTLCTFTLEGHTFVHISQFVQVSSFLLTFEILIIEPNPMNAPYGQRNRHQKFLKNKESMNITIRNPKPNPLISKKNVSIFTSEILLYGSFRKAIAP